LSEAGVWPIVVCTEPFRALAEMNAKAKGLPELDLIVIPHPLGVRPVDAVEQLGREVANRVASLAAAQ
jgi:hypothetical protein